MPACGVDNSGDSPVVLMQAGDPEIAEAEQKARDTFKYFWREMSWEQRRIVPGLGVAAIKAAFWDGPGKDAPASADQAVEHMWISQVEFDGSRVKGALLNAPNQLSSVSQGDEVEIPFARVEDWMYSINDRVYGAFTVQIMRSRMEKGERRQHDRAWGLDFGDPASPLLVPSPKPPRKLFGIFPRKSPEGAQWTGNPDDEHPMSLNMVEKARAHLGAHPDFAHQRNEQGWTILHTEALGGNAGQVQALLEHGADPAATTPDGRTPRQLAETLGWTRVLELLS